MVEEILWDAKTGELKQALSDQTLPVYALAFSPDSKTLAIGGGKGNTLKDNGKTTGELKLLRLEKDGSAGKEPEQSALPHEPAANVGKANGTAVNSKDVSPPTQQVKGIQADDHPVPRPSGSRTIPTGMILFLLFGGLIVLPLWAWVYLRKRRATKMPETITVAAKATKREPAASVAFLCSGCGKNLKAKVELAGKHVKCPKCHKALVVPFVKPTAPHSGGEALPVSGIKSSGEME
jgi:hypothetical protein